MGREGDHLECSRSYKYMATVCKRNQVDIALHFGMAHSVRDRWTDIIVAIARAAKNLKLHMPFSILLKVKTEMIRENTISIVPHRHNSVAYAATY